MPGGSRTAAPFRSAVDVAGRVDSHTSADRIPIGRTYEGIKITTGQEKFGGPVQIQGSVNGTAPDGVNGVVTFSSSNQMQRPALLLTGTTVTVMFGTSEERIHGSRPVAGREHNVASQQGGFMTSEWEICTCPYGYR
jgi:hypothetical protein